MTKLKNQILRIGFLFRPILPVATSFAFLVISSALLVVILFYLDANSKAYQVLLAILTGVTASLLIAIMMEMFNNYRFNVKRQRELREYLRVISSYELRLRSIMKTSTRNDNELGSGRVCAVFCLLNEIISNLRRALNSRDYLLQSEITEIDIILLEYNNVVKIIWSNLLSDFTRLVNNEVDEELESNDESIRPLESMGPYDPSEPTNSVGHRTETLRDYPSLLELLENEARRYVKMERGIAFYDESPEYLEDLVEKILLLARSVFEGYFEVTDSRYESVKNEGKNIDNDPIDCVNKYEYRSDMISLACGKIDQSMNKLRKKVAKEPEFWVVAKYKGES
jgi:hypothetical protein